MIWKYLEQNVLFPKGLNWVQHWVSRLGLLVIVCLRFLSHPSLELAARMIWFPRNTGEPSQRQEITMPFESNLTWYDIGRPANLYYSISDWHHLSSTPKMPVLRLEGIMRQVRAEENKIFKWIAFLLIASFMNVKEQQRGIFFHSEIVWYFSELAARGKTDADDTVGIIAGILGALVLIVIAIIGIWLYKR